jgi:hypothetical protein
MSERFLGRNALIVAAAGRPDWLRVAEPYFKHVEVLDDVILTRAGRPAMTLHTAYGCGLTSSGADL